jgi:hypothetical protein
LPHLTQQSPSVEKHCPEFAFAATAFSAPPHPAGPPGHPPLSPQQGFAHRERSASQNAILHTRTERGCGLNPNPRHSSRASVTVHSMQFPRLRRWPQGRGGACPASSRPSLLAGVTLPVARKSAVGGLIQSGGMSSSRIADCSGTGCNRFVWFRITHSCNPVLISGNPTALRHAKTSRACGRRFSLFSIALLLGPDNSTLSAVRYGTEPECGYNAQAWGTRAKPSLLGFGRTTLLREPSSSRRHQADLVPLSPGGLSLHMQQKPGQSLTGRLKRASFVPPLFELSPCVFQTLSSVTGN